LFTVCDLQVLIGIAMDAAREFDFVVFGASGFTGKYVTKEVQVVCEQEGLKWAIAGRSKSKLNEVLGSIQNKQSNMPEIIIADVNDYQSLIMMCKRCTVVLDCVGPYRFFGEQVVKACVEAKSHFVDISGEPQYLETMQFKYDKDAKENGVYVVGACGFDSIPSDLGVVYAQQKFKGTLNGIKSFLKISSPYGFVGHYGTFASAVHGLGDVKNLIKLRKSCNHSPLPLVGPKLKLERFGHYNRNMGSYTIPFLGSDNSVVKRSQRYLYENQSQPAVQYSMYSCISGLWYLFLLAVFGGIFKFLALRPWGRTLLLNNPKFFSAGYFSREGPTEKQMEETSFSLTMYGEGYSDGQTTTGRTDKPDKKIVVRVSGPEPGYVATPILMVQAAVVLLKEKENLPPSGGVLPPGAAFAKTSLISRLSKRGMKFEVLAP